MYERQLIMRWTNDGKTAEMPKMPEGLTLTTIDKRENGVAEWLELLSHGITDGVETPDYYKRAMTDKKSYSPDKCFFILRDGVPVATITVLCERHLDNGVIHMVACNENARGCGIGNLMNEIAVYTLKKEGMKTAHLTTDDERIPAIKSYLRAGFVPEESTDEYVMRWAEIMKIIRG